MEVRVIHQSRINRGGDTISILDDDKREIAIHRIQVKRLRAILKKVEK